jgi:hypothetical protein
MSEDFKNSESLKINISSTSTMKPRNLQEYLKSDNNDRRTVSDNTMQIYIKRKLNKKVINVNLSEQSSENEKIHIKIEKEKMRRSFVRDNSSPKKIEARVITENVNLTSAPNSRKDAYGNLIERGWPKKYKVTFLDLNLKLKNLKNFNRGKDKFIDLVKVESFKSFNNDSNEKEEDDDKTKCKCGCIIF